MPEIVDLAQASMAQRNMTAVLTVQFQVGVITWPTRSSGAASWTSCGRRLRRRTRRRCRRASVCCWCCSAVGVSMGCASWRRGKRAHTMADRFVYTQHANRRVDRDMIDVWVFRYDMAERTSESYFDGEWHLHSMGEIRKPMISLDGRTAHYLKGDIVRAIKDAAGEPDAVVEDLNAALMNFVYVRADDA